MRLTRSLLEATLLPALGAAAVVGVSYGLGRLLHLVPCDDAFITFRHARNFAEGAGLVYNPGEPLEATTNFLYALTLGLIAKAGLAPPLGARLLSFLALGTIGWLVLRDGIARGRGLTGTAAAATGLVALLAAPSLVVWANLGLETVFYSALLCGAVIALLEPGPGPARLVVSGILFGAAAGTRLEAMAVAGAVSVVLARLWSWPASRARLPWLLGGIAVALVPILALRWSWYGSLLPNTFHAKVGGGGPLLWLRGLRYALTFVGTHFLIAAAVPALFVRARRVPAERDRAAVLLAAIGAVVATTVLVGGDYFPFSRFLVPTLPFLALAVTDICQHGLGRPATDPGARPWLRARWLAPLAVLMLVATLGRGELRYLTHERRVVGGWARLGVVLRRNLPADATLLLGAAGATAYHSRLVAHDWFGLTDPVLARSHVPGLGLGLAGHEKRGGWSQVERLLPDVILDGPRPRHLEPAKLKRLYARMRLSAQGLPARGVLVKRSLVPRLGPAFQPIGAKRPRPPSMARLERRPARRPGR